MQRQPQQGGLGDGLKRTSNVFLFACRALAVTVEVFLHVPNTVGRRYLGGQVAAAAAFLFIFPMWFPAEDPRPVWWFLGAFIFMCASIRMMAVRRRARVEPEEHSFYAGRPRLMRLFKRASEATVKNAAEPALVWVVALFAIGASPPLGAYLFLAGAGLCISINMSIALERRRVMDMNDAMLEQRNIAERWRAMRRD